MAHSVVRSASNTIAPRMTVRHTVLQVVEDVEKGKKLASPSAYALALKKIGRSCSATLKFLNWVEVRRG